MTAYVYIILHKKSLIWWAQYLTLYKYITEVTKALIYFILWKLIKLQGCITFLLLK